MSPASPISVPEGPRAVVVSDVDGNAGPDLVFLTDGPGARVYLGDGAAVFSATSQGHVGITGTFARAAAGVPRPGSLRDDVLLATASVASPADLHLTRLRPEENSSGLVTRTSETVPGTLLRELVVLDADQDGLHDLLLPFTLPEAGLLHVRLGR
jgi:hypothetical protein